MSDQGGKYDVIIVGGGPAGLSAALILARCRRRVLVCDAGKPRNRASHGVHGFLTRDGILPAELLACARQQLAPYRTVILRHTEIVDLGRRERGFNVIARDGARYVGSKLLMATGMVDELPAITGIQELYGRSVHHCPYCDGWEWRDQPVAVYGRGDRGSGLALMLTLWTKDLVLCTDGPSELELQARRRLEEQRIPVREERILRLEGQDGFLKAIVLAGGERLDRRAMFFNTGQHQPSALLAKLGCRFDEKGKAETGYFEESNVPGLFVVGDASADVQLVVIAAAEGARAAFAINKSLLREAGLL